jgi:hypothetical protein
VVPRGLDLGVAAELFAIGGTEGDREVTVAEEAIAVLYEA